MFILAYRCVPILGLLAIAACDGASQAALSDDDPSLAAAESTWSESGISAAACIEGTCQIDCDGTTRHCLSTTNRCTAQRRNCEEGEEGYVICDGTVLPCPQVCPSCVPGSACDDRNSCTYNDRCTSTGSCVGTPVTCNSPPPCSSGPGRCSRGRCVYPDACAEDQVCFQGRCTFECVIDPSVPC